MRALTLDLQTDAAAGTFRLKLLDAGGALIAGREAAVGQIPASRWQVLLQPRAWARRERGRPEEALLEELGDALTRELLGTEIVEAIGRGIEARALEIRLGATDPLALSLARVPWELARTRAGRTLLQQNVAVRVALPGAAPPTAPGLGDEPLRVLLVFALAGDVAPLALRQERQAALTLLHDEVMPRRRLEVEVLAHGVTRAALREALVRPAQLICWSGHGGFDKLALESDAGTDWIRAEELVELFAESGNLPSLIVLNACSSASTLSARGWAELHEALRATERADRLGGEAAPLGAAGGFAGVAAALLEAGVSQVVAMRDSVDDVAARTLLVGLLRRLLVDGLVVEQALRQARKDAESARRAGALVGVDALDLAMPVLFAAGSAALRPPEGRSAQLERWEPLPTPLLPDGRRDLHPRALFVGRGAELARLAASWLVDGATPLAVIQGLAGQGKTALAAECIALWHGRFSLTLAFQAMPGPIAPQQLYRLLHLRLLDASPAYAARCRENPARAVHDPEERADRWDRLRENLVAALRDERVLLVLDNFETCQEEIATEGRFRARDPEWDRLLEALARDLRGSAARVLLTSRRRPVVEAGALWLPLGPLPVGEAALMIRELPPLRALITGEPADEARLKAVLAVSRGHPLLLEKLAALATDRAALDQALAALGGRGYGRLPDLFGARGDEQAYLADVTTASIDLLLSRVSPLARRLLWILQVAEEPLADTLIGDLWRGRTRQAEVQEKAAILLHELERRPEVLAAQPPEQVAMLRGFAGAAVPTRAPGEPAPPEPLLDELRSAGLVYIAGQSKALHPLVRERVAAWIAAHPLDRGPRDEREIRRLLADDYEFAFRERLGAEEPGARGLAVEAGRRALAYRVATGELEQAWPWLGALIGAAREPAMQRALAEALREAVGGLPEEQISSSICATVGAALTQAGALRDAETWLARAEGKPGDDATRCTILYNRGELHLARGDRPAALRDFARAAALAGRLDLPRVEVLFLELKALDPSSGDDAGQVLARLDEQLRQLRGWWARRQAGELVVEAPSRETLGIALDEALSKRGALAFRHGDPSAALALAEERLELARTRGEPPLALIEHELEQSPPLIELGRAAEALELAQRAQEPLRAAGHGRALVAARVHEAQAWMALGDPERAAARMLSALPMAAAEAPAELAGIHLVIAAALSRQGRPEAAAHTIAALAWAALLDLRAPLSQGLALLDQDRASAGQPRPLPRLADLLADPTFSALKEAFQRSGRAPEELQAALDARLAAPA